MGGKGAWPKSSVQKLCPHFWYLWWSKAGVSTDPRVDKGWGRRVVKTRERGKQNSCTCVYEIDLKKRFMGVFLCKKGREKKRLN